MGSPHELTAPRASTGRGANALVMVARDPRRPLSETTTLQRLVLEMATNKVSGSPLGEASISQTTTLQSAVNTPPLQMSDSQDLRGGVLTPISQNIRMAGAMFPFPENSLRRADPLCVL